jgi:hypothetical protein
MLSEVRDDCIVTPIGLVGGPGKHEGLRPFEIWLAAHVLGDDSWSDEQTGSVEWGAWYGRAGRRIVSEDEQGFVYVAKYEDAEAASAEMADLDRQYDEWLRADEGAE